MTQRVRLGRSRPFSATAQAEPYKNLADCDALKLV